MFEDNKYFADYLEGVNIEVSDTIGRLHEAPLSAVVEDFCINVIGDVDHETVVKVIKTIDAYYEDAGVTEDSAKALVGSWLQVVKIQKSDDKEWFDETNKFLRDCIDYLEE